MRMKDQVLGNVFRGSFSDPFLTESLTASTLSEQLAVNFLSDLKFSAFLLRLFTDPVV